MMVAVKQRFSIGKLAHLHAPISPAGKQPRMRIYMQLSHARSDILKEVASSVLSR